MKTFVSPEAISPDLVKKIRDLHRKILTLPEMMRAFSGKWKGTATSPIPISFPSAFHEAPSHLPNLAQGISHPLSLPLVILLCPERPFLWASPLPKDGHGRVRKVRTSSLSQQKLPFFCPCPHIVPRTHCAYLFEIRTNKSYKSNNNKAYKK